MELILFLFLLYLMIVIFIVSPVVVFIIYTLYYPIIIHVNIRLSKLLIYFTYSRNFLFI